MIQSRFENFLDTVYQKIFSPIFFTATILIFFIYQLLYSVGADPDLFARVAMGRLVEANGFVPQIDPFAFTEKKSIWIDHEWLSGLVFYLIASNWGDFGLYISKIILVIGTGSLLLSAQADNTGRRSPFVFFWSLILLLDSSFLWASTIRSQVFTYLFLALYLKIFSLVEKESKVKMLFILPVVMIFWANAHGGFVVGLGLTMVFSLIALYQKKSWAILSLIASGLTLAATLITPYHPFDFWGYVLDAVSMERPSIPEWDPVLPVSLKDLFSYLILAIVVLASFRAKFPKPLFTYAFCLLCAYFGFSHMRLMPLFYFVLIAYFADTLEIIFAQICKTFSRREAAFKRAFTLAIATLSGVFLVSFVIFAYKNRNFSLNYQNYPVHAIEWLRLNRNNGRLLVDFNLGSFALWRAYPKLQISLDGRYEEVYPNSTLQKVSLAFDCKSPEHDQVIKSLNPTDILVENSVDCFKAPYQLVYKDAKYSIYSMIALENTIKPTEQNINRPMWEAGF